MAGTMWLFNPECPCCTTGCKSSGLVFFGCNAPANGLLSDVVLSVYKYDRGMINPKSGVFIGSCVPTGTALCNLISDNAGCQCNFDCSPTLMSGCNFGYLPSGHYYLEAVSPCYDIPISGYYSVGCPTGEIGGGIFFNTAQGTNTHNRCFCGCCHSTAMPTGLYLSDNNVNSVPMVWSFPVSNTKAAWTYSYCFQQAVVTGYVVGGKPLTCIGALTAPTGDCVVTYTLGCESTVDSFGRTCATGVHFYSLSLSYFNQTSCSTSRFDVLGTFHDCGNHSVIIPAIQAPNQQLSCSSGVFLNFTFDFLGSFVPPNVGGVTITS